MKIIWYSSNHKQLRERVCKLEALLSAAQDEVEERNEAILELNEAYEVILIVY